jgi:hypothetical protein
MRYNYEAGDLMMPFFLESKGAAIVPRMKPTSTGCTVHQIDNSTVMRGFAVSLHILCPLFGDLVRL